MTGEDLRRKYFPIHDGGFVALVDWMGDDAAVAQAARVSYGAGTKSVSDDRGLLRYLMRHRHTTPFEMCEVKFHIQIEMDTHRQFVRHRTASINEYSTRYSEAIDSTHKTPPDQWRTQSKSNKQGSGDYLVVDDGGSMCGKVLSDEESYLHLLSRTVYEHRLEAGVAREQARKDLPLSTYTTLYWKCDLHNIFNFLRLRLDSHAQLEIRQYAIAMAKIVKVLFPLSWDAFVDYGLLSVNFTRLDRCLLKFLDSGRLYQDDNNSLLTELESSRSAQCIDLLGMSKREVEEFKAKITTPEVPNFDIDISTLRDASYYEELANEK